MYDGAGRHGGTCGNGSKSLPNLTSAPLNVSGQMWVVKCEWSNVSGQMWVVKCEWSNVSGQIYAAVI